MKLVEFSHYRNNILSVNEYLLILNTCIYSNMLKVVIAVFLRRDLKFFSVPSKFILKGQCHENCFQTEAVA